MIQIIQSYPGGSKGRVNKAGNNVSAGTATEEDLWIIEEWRSAHKAVLNTFQAILRSRTRSTDVVVAQRHKRKNTIFGKLKRFPDMQLARMDDIAGCRLIFPGLNELNKFRNRFLAANFDHKQRNDPEKYNYIKKPKSTGYRGIHDVYIYDVRSLEGARLKGLLIEIQYRTRIQHAWATTVEVIGYITSSQPKFQAGDGRYIEIMALASEILARAHESLAGPLPQLSDDELCKRFLALDSDLRLTRTLKGLNQAKTKTEEERKNIILVFGKLGELEMHSYRESNMALKKLFEIEKLSPEKDVVLVRAESNEDVRFAYKNYFSDATEFIQLLETGIKQLTPPNKVMHRSRLRRPGDL